MRFLILIFGFLFMHSGLVYGQYVIKSTSELEALEKLPLEKLYVQSNSSLLFPGEYMYYSVFCINASTNRLSNISRVGYLELIGENGESYIKQKFNLSQGRGQGDFFVPVTVPSGNYKLIAYTHWMRNAGASQFFQDDLVIINPYQSNQDNLLKGENEFGKDDPTMATSVKTLPNDKDSPIQIQTDKKVYGKREKVTLVIRNYRGNLGYGDYSINARHESAIETKSPLSSTTYSKAYLDAERILVKNVQDSIFLPEQRGELFYGRVLDANNDPVEDKTVIVSIPGNDFQLKSAITDTDGNFYTYVNRPYVAPFIIAQTLETNSTGHKVLLNEKSNINYEAFEFGNFTLHQDMEKAILERSVLNQIENAYYSAKPDSVIQTSTVDPFEGGSPDVVNLDEFTRFSTMKETLIEVVPNVWVKKLDNDNYTFWVREKVEKYEDDFESDPPLVLVDGIFIPDHRSILDFNANLVEKISILRDPLVLGNKKYLGMVVIETIEGDYLNRISGKNSDIKQLVLPAGLKNYYAQSYTPTNEGEFSRIPDFRSQVYWNPRIVVDEESNTKTYEFYTSDLEGEYELILEGFTSYGKPISIREKIEVN